jgi:hypothetical protein
MAMAETPLTKTGSFSVLLQYLPLGALLCDV